MVSLALVPVCAKPIALFGNQGPSPIASGSVNVETKPSRLIRLVEEYERAILAGDLVAAQTWLELIETRARRLRAMPKDGQLWLAELEITKPANIDARMRKSRSDLLREFELRTSTNSYLRDAFIGVLAFTAEQVDEVDRAREYAQEALRRAAQQSDESGKQTYYGNTVLGLLALRENRVTEANMYLLASVNVDSWTALKQQGPNLKLASRLLDRLQREVVVRYLEECKKLWPAGEMKLSEWQDTIRQGSRPSWGYHELEGIP
jgi:hypothetical protein